MSSIINESRKSQKKGKSLIIFTIIIICSASFYFFYLKDNQDSNTETQVELQKEIFEVIRDDLKILINSSGKIVNEDNVNLSFHDVGMKITEIYVKEGDIVKKGDKLAQVDSSAFESELKSAEANKALAVTNLETELEGGTKINLLLAEKDLQSAEMSFNKVKEQNELTLKSAKMNLINANKNLDQVRKEVLNDDLSEDISMKGIDLNLNQSIEDAHIKLNTMLRDINDSIDEVDDILDDNDAEDLLGDLKNRTLDDAEDSFDDARRSDREYWQNFPTIPDYGQEYFLINAFTEIYNVLENTEIMLEDTETLLDNTSTNIDFTSNDLSRMQNKISDLKSDIKSDKNNAISSKQSLESAILNKDSKSENSDIISENNQNKISDAEEKVENIALEYEKTLKNIELDEKNAELSLDIAKTQYKEKTDGVSGADLAALKADIDKAQVQVDQAIYELGLTTLTSPIDGELTEFNGTVGDIVTDINNEPFAVVINRNSFYTDVSVEEIDIAKLKLGQKIYATIEALDDIELPGTITHIAVTGDVDNNGVVSYDVRALLDDSILKDVNDNETFSNPLRAGMTADIDFIITETNDVLVIPVSAVKRRDNRPQVELENGEFGEIKTGFTDGKMVEIISGLNKGEKVMYVK